MVDILSVEGLEKAAFMMHYDEIKPVKDILLILITMSLKILWSQNHNKQWIKSQKGWIHSWSSLSSFKGKHKVKGMQVAPSELENLLHSHPAVQDAAVVGVPHEYNGEAPKAFIIRKNGQKTTEKEIQDYVASKVAEYKKIEKIMFVKEIPKMPSGKILRQKLKKMYS